MQIIDQQTRRSVTMAQAVQRVACEHPALLQSMLVRLLEELSTARSGAAILCPQQLARVLEYSFDVEG